MTFHGVYLLYSKNPKFLGRNYIGYTVDPTRREKQHNKGKDFGGAWKTSNRGPWDMVLIVHGFPNEIAALRFEWAWQHPKMSRRLQHIPKKKSKETSYTFCLRVLKEMLQTPPWKILPLTLQWLKPEYQQDLDQSSLPSHMPIAIGPIPPKSKPKSLPQYEELQCSLCHKHIEEEDGLYCTDEACTLVAHMICLARSFLNTPDEYIPVRGRCPECNLMLLWGDLIRARQGV